MTELPTWAEETAAPDLIDLIESIFAPCGMDGEVSGDPRGPLRRALAYSCSPPGGLLPSTHSSVSRGPLVR